MFSTALLCALIAALSILRPVDAHVSANPSTAVRGSYAAIAFRVPHGCGEDSSRIVTVGIPFNVTGVKPRRVAGWNITMTYRPLNPPTTDAHGNPVNTTIDSISWTALTPADALPNAYYEDFSIQMKLPTAADGDVLYFPTIQNCTTGTSELWIATGNQTGNPSPKVTLTDATTTGSGSSSLVTTTKPSAASTKMVGFSSVAVAVVAAFAALL